MLFTFPSRYCFTIGHRRYLALDGGPPCFNRNSTCSGLLGVSSQEGASFSPTGLSPSAARFPNTIRLRMPFLTSRGRCGSLLMIPTTPMTQRPQSWHVFGLGFSPFAHHYSGNLCRFLFLRLLRCFTSPGASPFKRVTGFLRPGCPIRVSAGQRSLAPLRSFSQLATPFFGRRCQGIHRMPLLPCPRSASAFFGCHDARAFYDQTGAAERGARGRRVRISLWSRAFALFPLSLERR